MYEDPSSVRRDGTARSETSSIARILPRPSPEKALPISPAPDLNLYDLELLHQFLTSTCFATAQLPEVTAQMQLTIPLLAQTYPFVMRGILARAATHLSRLRPSRQSHYAMLAASHHDKALTDFRTTLQNMNESNCNALVLYAKGLVWCALASHDPYDDPSVRPISDEEWLPQWFYLLRGSCQIVNASKDWLGDSPHAIYLQGSPTDFSDSPDDHQIAALLSELQPMFESTSCEMVLMTLREAFARTSIRPQNTPYRNAINLWVGALPDDYIKSLQQKEPWALIALAHFCVLFHRSETVWFMKGHGTRLLVTIIENLDIAWRRFVQWPCEELQIEWA